MSTWNIIGAVSAAYALFLVVLACCWNPRFQQHVRREDEMVSLRMRDFAAAKTRNPETITADPQPPGAVR